MNRRQRPFVAAAALMLFTLGACITPGGFSAGDLKNSFPLWERNLVEEVQVIAVPAFHGDSGGWRELSQELITSVPRLTVVPYRKVEASLREARRDLPRIAPDNRAEALVAAGRAVQADAVLNGVLVKKDERTEIVLQLLSVHDSRVLWWQAADYSLSGDTLPRTDQKALLAKMLEALFPRLARRERPAPPPVPKTQPRPEEQPRVDAPVPPEPEQQKDEPSSKPELRPKADKKPERKPKATPPPAEISPM